MEHGYLARGVEFTEGVFMSPAVITEEEHGSIKIALDSKQLNEATIKTKEPMANLRELNSQIERKTSEGRTRTG